MDDRTETHAQLIHARRHRAGYGQICGRCLEEALGVRRPSRWARLLRRLGKGTA